MLVHKVLHSLLSSAAILTVVTVICFIIVSCNNSIDNSSHDTHTTVQNGRQQYLNGDYTSALTTLQSALPDTAFMDTDDYINTYYYIGNIHFAYGDFMSAARHYEKAYRRAVSARREKAEIRMLINLALSSCHTGNRDKALYYGRLLTDMKAKDRDSQRYFTLLLKGYIGLMFDNPSQGVADMMKTIQFVDSAGMEQRLKLSPASALCEHYENIGMLDSALSYLAVYDSLAVLHNLSNLVVDTRRAYMRLYTKAGNMEHALKYQEEYFHLQDSLMNPEGYMSIRSSFQQEQQRESEERIASLRLTVTTQQVLIVTIVIALLAIGGFIFIRNKYLIANRQLFRRNREIVRLEQSTRSEVIVSPKSTAVPETETTASVITADRELYQRILDYMDSGQPYCNPDFSLSVLAGAVESNTKYVSQAINEFSGGNFRNFLNGYRVREARRRLIDVAAYGHLTIQSVAESVGFTSASVFNTAFRKFTGMTPSLYQKMARQEGKKEC
ncbi:MAG: helix-turn-helix domain-containing protein [Muribaculaceae bacterium]|nr:helix-turn-helix domain-containing protein [Muribaculaceae bacterium]